MGAVDFIKKLFNEAKEAQKETIEKMKEYRSVYGRGHRSGEGTENRVFSIVEQELAIMTDSRPQIAISSRKKGDEKIAPVLNTVVNASWDRMNLDAKRDKLLRHQKICGTGFVKLFWDGGEVGLINATIPDPTQIFVDPDATDMEDAKYIMWAGHKPLVYLEEAYKNGKDVKPGDSWGIDYNTDTKDVKSPLKSGKGKAEKCYPTASVVECFYLDPTDGVKKVATVANGLLLKPKGREAVSPLSKLYKHNKFPYVRVINYDADKFFGISEVEILMWLQAKLNERQEKIAKNIDELVKAVWLVVGATELDEEAIKSTSIGDILFLPNGAQAARQVGPSLPADAWNSVADLRRAMEDVSGLNEVSFGRTPREVQSGYMLDLLQEASVVRLRRTGRNLEYAFKDFGEQLLSNIKQYYTVTDTYEWAGEYVDFKSDKMDESDQYKMQVDFVSALPISKAILRNMAIQLLGLGVIDKKAVIETFERPSWNEALERIEAKEQQMLAAAQAAQAAKTGGTSAGEGNGRTRPVEQRQGFARTA